MENMNKKDIVILKYKKICIRVIDSLLYKLKKNIFKKYRIYLCFKIYTMTYSYWSKIVKDQLQRKIIYFIWVIEYFIYS